MYEEVKGEGRGCLCAFGTVVGDVCEVARLFECFGECLVGQLR